MVCDQRRDWETQFFGGGDIKQKGKVQTFELQGDLLIPSPPPPSPLVGHPNLCIRKTLRRELGLLTVMILKRVSESIFFQSSKSTECKVKDEKEVANSLMSFSLLKIIYPF